MVIKIEGYKEISKKEFDELPGREGVSLDDFDNGKSHYFKKVQTFSKCPRVFIERAELCTIEGISAICGTDQEYSEYVEKILKEKKDKEQPEEVQGE